MPILPAGFNTTPPLLVQSHDQLPVQIPLYAYTVDAPTLPAWILYQLAGTGDPAAWIFPFAVIPPALT